MRWRFGFTRFASWSERPSGADDEARGSSGQSLVCVDSNYCPARVGEVSNFHKNK